MCTSFYDGPVKLLYSSPEWTACAWIMPKFDFFVGKFAEIASDSEHVNHSHARFVACRELKLFSSLFIQRVCRGAEKKSFLIPQIENAIFAMIPRTCEKGKSKDKLFAFEMQSKSRRESWGLRISLFFSILQSKIAWKVSDRAKNLKFFNFNESSRLLWIFFWDAKKSMVWACRQVMSDYPSEMLQKCSQSYHTPDKRLKVGDSSTRRRKI